MSQAPTKVELTITLNLGTGKSSMSGPLRDPMLCARMLAAGNVLLTRHVLTGTGRKVKMLDEVGVNPTRQVS